MHDHLWGINMKALMDHLIEERGEEREFRHLPEVYCNSPCRLSESTSERFSERMINAANVLVDTHWLRSDDEHMHKMIALRMSKRFMERVRTKNSFSSVMFSDVLFDESTTLYFAIIAIV